MRLWDGITCNHLTGDVIGIDISYGMLQGTLHPNTSLFDLPHLQRLNIAYNNFTASQRPHNIGRSSNSLTHLNISSRGFTDDIPREILFLPKLVSLDLSSNQGLHMHPYVLENLLRNSTRLREVAVGGVDIGWVLPTYLNISSSLKSLDLSWTGLQGKLSDNMFNLPYLEKLELGANWLLTGPWPQINKSISIPLEWLGLGNTNLSGETFGSIGHLKSLKYLNLVSCSLFGPFPNSLFNLTHLTTLDLEANMLNETLPYLLFTLPLIEEVFLGFNLFSGGLPSELFKCRSLKVLVLRQMLLDGKFNQSLTSSLLTQLINLNFLDLQSNNFKGVWNFETLLSSLPNLQGLELSYSGLTVVSGNSTTFVNPGFWYLNLQSCNLNVFPASLRAMKNLQYLCLSGNNIQGRIPDWAREIGGKSYVFFGSLK